MDRKTVTGYVLILAIVMGYVFLTKKNVDEAQVQDQQKDSTELVTQPADTAQRATTIQPGTATPDDSNRLESVSPAQKDSVEAGLQKTDRNPEVFGQMENEVLQLRISSHGGRITGANLKEYERYDSTELSLIGSNHNSFNYILPVGQRVVNTQDIDFEKVSSSDTQQVWEHNFPEGGKIRYTYTLTKGYRVHFNMQLVGMEDIIPKRFTGFDLNWNLGLHRQESDAESERDATSVYYKYFSEKGISSLSDAGNDEEKLQSNVHWISFRQKFFNSTLIFPQGLKEGDSKIEIREPEEGDTMLEYASAALYVPYDFNTGEGQKMDFFFGPNHFQTLKKEKIKLEKIIPMGSNIIGLVNKWIIVPIFNWLNNYFTSYGIIILLLTIIIKLMLIFPMYKIYVSSAKMKLLKPELDEIKAKVGNDMQKMQQEQMKLYKKAGVSPFGGCLPQLIQFPILLAMFRFFPASIELRRQPFLWATDLSTYDVIYQWDAYIPILSNWYGNHISLFTLLMAASTLLYTMMNSSQMGAGGKQMKYIMYLMPLLLLFWFNSYSSGLSYYYFLANMISFGQNWIFRNFIVDDAKLHRQIEANKKKKVSVKKSNWQKRLEKMAQQRGIDPKTGRKK